MKPCSLPTCRAGLHQFSAAKSHMTFLSPSHEKDSFERARFHSYTLVLLYNGPNQDVRSLDAVIPGGYTW